MGKKQGETQAYVVCFSVTSEMIACGIVFRIQVIINIGQKHCKLSEKNKYIGNVTFLRIMTGKLYFQHQNTSSFILHYL